MEGKKINLPTTEEFSISCIHKNWVAAQKIKLAKLSRSKHKDSTKLATAHKSQTKEGRFHVFVRGHNSYTLFYDKEDRVHFLSILDEETKKAQAHISAFILMDNHFHMQVVTSRLSHLMKNILARYSYRFRRKYGIQGPVFNSPFGRSQIFSYLLAKENLLYILSNASRENLCDTHRDYIWSSYNSHPQVIHLRKNGMLPLLGKPAKSTKVSVYKNNNSNSRTKLHPPKRRRGKLPSAKMIEQNDISKVLEVDVSFMLAAFKNLEDLDYSIHSYEPLNSGLLNRRALNTRTHNTRTHNTRTRNTKTHNTKIVNKIPSNQAYNGQPFHKQSYNGQAFHKQSYNGQAFHKQANNEQTYHKQANNGQPYHKQANNEQTYHKQSYNGQAFHKQANNEQPYHKQSNNGQPFNKQANNGQAFHKQANNEQPFHKQANNEQPYHKQAYNGQPFHKQANNGQAFHKQSYNGQPFHKQANNEQTYHKQANNGQPFHKQPNNGFPINSKGNKKVAKHSSDSEVISLFMSLLNGRKITSLNTQERSQIISTLKRVKGATHRQISSIMRIKYLDM